VVRTYQVDSSRVTALRGVDLDLAPGTITALVGPSGSGKSTLLRLLGCVDRPDEGRIEIAGTDVVGLSAPAGYGCGAPTRLHVPEPGRQPSPVPDRT
jgi:ABC-type lipoprotein export system ATPase subunit